jgi:hypothetical protein
VDIRRKTSTTLGWASSNGRCMAMGLMAIMSSTTPASAAERTDTTVTIRAQSGGFYGYVRSSDPSTCVTDRVVVLYKQLGESQNPSTDKRISSDTASSDGRWDTGDTGTRTGRFYARVRATPDCKADRSKTISAQA